MHRRRFHHAYFGGGGATEAVLSEHILLSCGSAQMFIYQERPSADPFNAAAEAVGRSAIRKSRWRHDA